MERKEFERIYKLQKADWWFGKSRNAIVISLLKKYFKNTKGIKLLDIGCSEGAFLEFLEKENIDFSAIDIDETAIKICQERGYGDKVKYGSATNIPFEDASFDTVTALDVVEHIQDDKKVISEMKRVCKVGGHLLFIVPVHPWLWSSNDAAYHHVKRYRKSEIIGLVKSLNLQIEKITYFMSFLFPFFVFVTYWKKIFQPHKIESNVVKFIPRWFNIGLSGIMKLEKELLLNYNLPFGSSIIVVARKS